MHLYHHATSIVCLNIFKNKMLKSYIELRNAQLLYHPNQPGKNDFNRESCATPKIKH